MKDYLNQQLFHFIQSSPTAFHAVDTIKKQLDRADYLEIKETEHWNLSPGQGYFVTRNDSSIIAFYIPKKGYCNFRIVASHSDSPTFKIKVNPEITAAKAYVKLNVEKYGGMLCAPWLDRPLSIAGRIVIKTPSGFVTKLVNIDRDLVMIPNVAIHMNRKANDGFSYNPQTDLHPLFSTSDSEIRLMDLIADSVQISADDILGHDLFLYNRQEPCIWGANNEFLSAPRLDDLQCTFTSVQSLIDSEVTDHIAMACVFDNEEVGSSTKQGADSTFLSDTLWRITDALHKTKTDYLIQLANSFMVSADNAHSIHPNHPELCDPINQPICNQGIVIKYNANQKYCTDAVSAAVFTDICNHAGVPVQSFVNRSDMAGGSTLGNISGTHVSVSTVDIGLAQLAMHSPYETAGSVDTYYLYKALQTVYGSGLK